MDSYRVPSRVLNGDFAGWLRDEMGARGVSTRVVALRTGVNHSTVSRLMRGEREPTLATALALLRYLGRDELGEGLATGILPIRDLYESPRASVREARGPTPALRKRSA